MNNLELRKALQKINHACGEKDCNDGHQCLGYHEETDEYEWGMCQTCSGTGIDIPLEFGCEVEVRRWGRSESEICIFVNYGHDGLMDKDNKTIGYDSDIVFQNLGKPSTEGDLLRAMYKNDDENYSNWTFIQGIAGDKMVFEYHDKEMKGFIYDLSKTVEEQTQEVTDQLIEILT